MKDPIRTGVQRKTAVPRGRKLSRSFGPYLEVRKFVVISSKFAPKFRENVGLPRK